LVQIAFGDNCSLDIQSSKHVVDVLSGERFNFDLYLETLSVFSFNVLRCPNALEIAFDHYAQSGR
jgi:hypothetical protein